jgi:hypothetical protein
MAEATLSTVVESVSRAEPARVWRSLAATGVAAIGLAVAYLLAPTMGTDLSAQVARADFLSRYGLATVDFRWYGGVYPHGYSLVSPALMALFGARTAGALAVLVSSAALVLLFLRTGARRPALAGALGAACFTGNLVSGRVTYAIGVAFGLLALLALTASARWLRIAGAVAGAVLAALTSPVAGLFVGLAGVALFLTKRWHGVWLAAGAGVPMAVMTALFGSGGWMNISRADTRHAVVTGVAVALLVPRPAVRIGALLSALGVLGAYFVHTPVGLNATRLATMFAIPVVAAYVDLSWLRNRWVGAAGLIALLWLGYWWQPPYLEPDLRDAGNPTASETYFRPLTEQLARRAPTGRVEVVPTRDYWEAAYVGDTVPLARGWLRQADLAYNEVFFDGDLDADRYRTWLVDNGVSYVAVSGAQLSWVGRGEADLIRGGLPYLTEVWRSTDWVLYRVAGDPSIVDGGRLVTAAPDAVTVDVPAAGDVLVRVRYSRWLRVTGPAGARLAADGDWTRLHVERPGRYKISGDL